MKSDSMWIRYFQRSKLHIEGELPRDDWSHFRVHLSVSKGRLIKWGFRPITEQEEDDLRIVLQNHQPNETNQSSEERDSEEDNWKDTKEKESSSEIDDESNKEKLSQPNETNWALEERDLEDDNWINTDEEESSSETEHESRKEHLFESLLNSCCADGACRSFNSKKKLILGSSYRQKRYSERLRTERHMLRERWCRFEYLIEKPHFSLMERGQEKERNFLAGVLPCSHQLKKGDKKRRGISERMFCHRSHRLSSGVFSTPSHLFKRCFSIVAYQDEAVRSHCTPS